jgi:predicted enzyme related to lactoylglutathione lyase
MRFRAFESDPRKAYRTESFYTRVFGWDFSPFQGPEDFWPLGIESAPASLAAAEPSPPPPPRTLSQPISVVSLEQASARILNQGGKILSAPIAIPGTGYLVYCQDEGGHPFGILEAESEGDDDSLDEAFEADEPPVLPQP